MATFETMQYRFTQGEMTPDMIGRGDLEQHSGALAICKNGWTSAEGWVGRRPGLETIGMVELVGSTVNGVIDNNPDNTDTTIKPFERSPNIVSMLTFMFDEPVNASSINLSGIKTFLGAIKPEFEGQVNTATFRVQVDVFLEDGTIQNRGARLSQPPDAALPDRNDVIEFDDYFADGVKNFNTRNATGVRFRIEEDNVRNNSRFTAAGSITPEIIATPDTAVNMINFIFNTDQTYLMILVDGNIFVYRKEEDGMTRLQTTIPVPRLDTNDKITTTHAIYSADTLILLQEDTLPYEIKRMGSHTDWSVKDLVFEQIPEFAFGGEQSSVSTATMSVGARTGNITINLNNFSTFEFSEESVGQYVGVVNNGSGRARITKFLSLSSVEATTVEDFNKDSFLAADWEYQHGYEPIWSETRGYPRRAAFHGNRLYIDGGKSLPSFLYGSKINQFFNFNFGSGILATDAVGPATTGLDVIEAIISKRSLVVFASGNEYIVPQTLGEPIIPSNFSLIKQTDEGIQRNLQPIESNSGIYYVKRGGKSIQEFTYPESVDAIPVNRSVSLIASHLTRDIIDFALRAEFDTAQGAYIMMPRENGDMTICNILAAQEVGSFFNIETIGGNFIACQSDNEDMYFVVQRGENLFIERFNFDITLDNARIISYADHKDDETFDLYTFLTDRRGSVARGVGASVIVNIPSEKKWIDYGLQSTRRSPDDFNQIIIDNPIDGTLELPDDAIIIVGFDYEVDITTMPVDVPQNQFAPTSQSRKLQVNEVSLRLIDTADCEVLPVHSNSKPVQYIKNSGIDTNRLTKVATSDTLRKTGFRGWGNDGQIKITQGSPFPMKIAQIKKRIRSR